MVGDISLELRLPAVPEAVGVARKAIASLEGFLTPSAQDDVVLLVSELVTNSVRHGGMDETGWIGMRVASKGDTLRIEVSNPGRAFERPPSAGDAAGDSGWGLFLVDRISSRWGVAPGDATKVWFELDDFRRNGTRVVVSGSPVR
jgi:anti-sigma regulatory factor (Ser/Thr protein kinase)